MPKNHGVSKLTDNRFLNLYHICAVDTKGHDFDYFFVSRQDEEQIKLKTKSLQPEGIVIYAVTAEEEPRLVLIRQYRYPLDEFIYELPAGLIDAGETFGMAAARELKEETGLDFTEYTGGNQFYRRPYYMGPGFTDETSATVFGTASGTISGQLSEDSEEIQVILADKEKVKQVLATERVSLRGAYLMMHFLQADKPFAFLDC